MKTKLIPSSFAIFLLALFIGFTFSTCKKDTLDINHPQHDSFTLQDFFDHHAVTSEYFTINSAIGGTFTSTKGSQIVVAPNSFSANGTTITGNVTMEFKDVYNKSDMILSQMPTTLLNGGILESGGMFFLNVMQGSQVLDLAPGKSITIKMPLDSGAVSDSSMAPFFFAQDTTAGGGWVPSSSDSIYINQYNYTYILYNLYSGSWYNCDTPGPFASNTQTTLILHQNDAASLYGTQVYLVFPGINAIVHIYEDYLIPDNFTYNYAPLGLPCTLVAIGVKNSELYYAKQDFTIAQNSTVNFSMTQTTETDLINLLNSLNN